MSTAMTKGPTTNMDKGKERVGTIRQLLAKQADQIKIALPRGFTPEHFNRVVMTEIQKNPKLGECEPMSVVRAVMEAAQLGLEIGGQLGHGYLIPRYSKAVGGMAASFQPGYKGLVDLVYRSGKVSVVYAKVVHVKDYFEEETNLDKDRLVHRRFNGEDRGPAYAAYAIARMKDGSSFYKLLYQDEIEKIGARGGNIPGPNEKKDTPWTTDTEAMWCKTVLKQLTKTLPLSVEDQRHVARAMHVDDLVTAGEATPHEDILDAGFESVLDDPPPDVSKLKTLAATMPAGGNTDGSTKGTAS